MKLFGLIAIVFITFSACQKENLRPACPSSSPAAETAPEAQAIGIVGRPETGTSTTPDDNGEGIVDPNADQDSNTKAPKKGK